VLDYSRLTPIPGVLKFEFTTLPVRLLLPIILDPTN